MAVRKSRFAAIVSKVRMEELEQRIMLSLPAPTLPTAPTPLQGTVSIPTSMGPQLFDSTFHFNNLYFQSGGSFIKGDGSGQTIAIIDPYGSPTLVNDVKVFDSFWGLTNNDSTGQFFLSVQPLAPTIHSQQFPDTADVQLGWSSETSLDVEWAHAVAPRAHILLVEPATQDPYDVLDANVYAANQPGVVVVSNSIGYPYSATNPDGTPNAELQDFFQQNPQRFDGFFVTPTGHLDSNGQPGGVSFFASSGDTFSEFDFPAGAFNVIPVGGENVATDLNGNLNNFGPWIGPNPGEGSGGATDGLIAPTHHEPLVSLDADPRTGVWVYDTTVGSGLNVGWSVVGGTSLAAPAWAAFTAVIDQGLELNGKPSLDSDMSNDFGQNNFQYQIMAAGEEGITHKGSTASIDQFTFTTFAGLGAFPLWPNGGVKTDGTPSFLPNPGSSEPSDIPSIPDLQNTGFGLPDGFALANFIITEDWSPVLGIINQTFPNTGTDIAVAAAQNEIIAIGDSLELTAGATMPVVNPASLSADYLHFIEQPTSTGAGQIIPTFQIEALKTGNNQLDTAYNGPISISLGTSPGATLAGTTSVNAVNGIATFSGLSIASEGDYSIFASATGKAPVVSNDFSVTVGPQTATSLAVTQEPGPAWQFGVMPPMRVSVLDQFGNVVVTDSSNIGVSILSGPPGALIHGNLVEPTKGGIATFADLSINVPGTYTFKFTDGALTAAVTGNATIVPIPVTQRYTFNGAPLSTPSILLQQQRNAIVFTIAGPPNPTLVAAVQAAQSSSQAATEVALFTHGFAAVQAAPASSPVFASTGSITDASSSVLGAAASNDNLLN
jgi:hypothetical protein